MNGLVLAIDATSPLASAALAEAGRPLSQAVAPARSDRSLIDLVAEALRSASRRPPELRAVIALCGPGSFTGVRVTLATAMGLAPNPAAAESGAQPVLHGMSSLAALALQAPDEARTILTLVDALRGERFAQRFERAANGLRPVGAPLREAASSVPFDGVDAIVAFPEAASELAPGAPPVLAAAALALPVALAVSIGAAGHLLKPDLEPLYLRAPAVTIAARRGA